MCQTCQRLHFVTCFLFLYKLLDKWEAVILEKSFDGNDETVGGADKNGYLKNKTRGHMLFLENGFSTVCMCAHCDDNSALQR